MKILFVLENYMPHIGGVETVFMNLANGLVKLGYKVGIVTHRLKGTKRFEIINGVNVYRVDCFYSRYLFSFLSIPKVLNLAKKADLIHTTTFNGAFPAWVTSKILRKPCIITIHEVWHGKWRELTEMGRFNAFIHNILESFIYMLNFDRYVCDSKSTQKHLLEIKIKKSKIDVVYCGIDYSHWNPTKYNGKRVRKDLGLERNFVYFFYGRPGISKGLKYLIQAVPLISKRIHNSKLVAIVSRDKAYKKKYSNILKLINKLNIQDKIILLDPIPYNKLPNYVKAADCVVVPSLAEGFGFTAAEACALERPVVASNTTSLPEVVSGKYILVRPKDPKAIADAVRLIFERKIKSKKKKVFSWKRAINGYLNIYKVKI